MKKIRTFAEYGAVEPKNEWQQSAHPYKVTLKYEDRQMTIPFFMGRALTHEPTDEDVLPCLLSDYQTTQYADSFEDWAEALGYNTDSREAESIYKQVLRQSEKLQKFLGSDFEEIAKRYEDL